MSKVFKLVSGLLSPKWRAAGEDLAMSQLEFENSGLLTSLEPCSLGEAPEMSAVVKFVDSNLLEANFLVVVFMLSFPKSIVESDIRSFLPGMG